MILRRPEILEWGRHKDSLEDYRENMEEDEEEVEEEDSLARPPSSSRLFLPSSMLLTGDTDGLSKNPSSGSGSPGARSSSSSTSISCSSPFLTSTSCCSFGFVDISKLSSSDSIIFSIVRREEEEEGELEEEEEKEHVREWEKEEFVSLHDDDRGRVGVVEEADVDRGTGRPCLQGRRRNLRDGFSPS